MTATRNRVSRLGLLLAVAAGTLACSRDATSPLRAPAARATVEATGTQVVAGEYGPGATYGLYLPENWNGDLVLFVHGWFGPAGPPMPAEQYMPAPLREGLLGRGYGLALSSFTYGGFAIKDAAVRTAQLEALFANAFARPDRTFIMSLSLGAAVAMNLAEQNPGKYAGVMPMCGIVAGVPFEINHIFNTRVLFDYYFPGVLEGDALDNPELNVGAVMTALGGDLPRARELADVDQIAMSYGNDAEMIADIVYALNFNAMDMFTNDVRLATHGHQFFDNSRTVYSGSADDAALNAGVDRFTAAPDAAKMLRNLYTPSGDLKTRVLTLHTRADPVVPLRHETALANLVAQRGAAQYLLQRVDEGAVHCATPTADVLQAMDDLAAWASTGVKPAS